MIILQTHAIPEGQRKRNVRSAVIVGKQGLKVNMVAPTLWMMTVFAQSAQRKHLDFMMLNDVGANEVESGIELGED